MSSLQLLLDLADSLNSISSPSSPYYNNQYNSDFGLGLNPYQIQQYESPRIIRLPLGALQSRLENQPIIQLRPKNSGLISNIGKDGFQVCMDVQQFKPSELSVKVVDNFVVVEGKHEEREDDHGFISRHFVRRYALPRNYDSDKVLSTLSSDGVLTVSIPKPTIENKQNEKIIQIQQTGPAHLNVKENVEEKPKDSKAIEEKNDKK
ncbi:heat shock protein 23-like [Episyrphus balteatus]|uniref:heat shock protein 23-like n=1 Tax=Episyrphus balteatus TaxID=286459 RepID=UPI002485297F|nr:heat shock protein 23-like [Episyrphus balteatus]